MRNALAAAIFAVFALPNLAHAGAPAADQAAAIRLCRAEVAAQVGVGLDTVRLDQVRTRTRQVAVNLDVWRNGQLQNVRCEVARGAELRIASITPDLRAIAQNQ